MRTIHGTMKRTARVRQPYTRALVVYKNEAGDRREAILDVEAGHFNGKYPTGSLWTLIHNELGKDLGVILDVKGEL